MYLEGIYKMMYFYFKRKRTKFVFRGKLEANSLTEAQKKLGEKLRPGDHIQSPFSGVYWKFDGLEFEPYTRML
jgi:hypothetical protein